MKRGFLVMLANGDAQSFSALDSIAHTMHMPYVNWQIPTAMQVCGHKLLATRAGGYWHQ
jgi:hypothetical protein